MLEEMRKPTRELTPRQKGLHRVLMGTGLRFSSEEALDIVTSQLYYAGLTPLELTPRGIENAELNLFVLTPEQADKIEIEYSKPEEGEEDKEPEPITGWFDITQLYGMAQRDEFIQHQVNRYARMTSYMRANYELNFVLPVLQEIEPLSLQGLMGQLGIEMSELSEPTS